MNLNQMLRAGWTPETDPDGYDVLHEFATSLGVGGMLNEPAAQQMLTECYGVLWYRGKGWIPPGAFRTYQYMRRLVLDTPMEPRGVLSALNMADTFKAAAAGRDTPNFAASLDSAMRLAGIPGLLALVERAAPT